MVVEVQPTDDLTISQADHFDPNDPLRVMRFQEELEEHETDGSCTADERFREREIELRLTQILVCSRADFQSVTLLVAKDDFKTFARRV